MITFFGIFAASVASLLAVQHLDVECAEDRKQVKIKRAMPISQASFDGAVTQP